VTRRWANSSRLSKKQWEGVGGVIGTASLSQSASQIPVRFSRAGRGMAPPTCHISGMLSGSWGLHLANMRRIGAPV
jgi:hypothetical protein